MSRPPRRAKAKIVLDEHSLQVTLLHFLALNHAPDVFWFAIPNAGKRSRWAAMRMKKEGMVSGVADLCIMLTNGEVAWFELKTGRNKQTEAQLAFQEICRRLMHPYFVVRTLSEAANTLHFLGALKPGWKL